MVAKYIHITNPMDEKNIIRKIISSHNNWILGKEDNLLSDTMYVITTQNTAYFVRRDITDQHKYQNLEWIKDEYYNVNWFMKEPYTISTKKDTGFIICGNQASIGLFYFIKRNSKNEELLNKKQKIVINALKNTLLPIWQDNISEKNDFNFDRNDFMINGKKVAGCEWIGDEDRIELTMGIQNIFTQTEAEKINYLMKQETKWENLNAPDIITGANMKLENFMANIQTEIDLVYK